MQLSELLDHLKALDIKLVESAGKLKIDAPKDALTPALVEVLRDRKEELIAALAGHHEPGPAPSDVPIPRLAAASDRPLSFAQQRLLFLEMLGGNPAHHNQFQAVRLSGSLRVELLVQSLQEIVRHHDILRTTFPRRDPTPRQVVAPADDYTLDIPIVECVEEDVSSYIRQESERPFDLERGPLVRAMLVRTAPERHYLLLTMHHLVTDGWSTAVLMREFAAVYEAFSRGAPSPLQPLQLQYGDYAAWQRGGLSSEQMTRQLEFWKAHLDGAPPLLHLPTDRPRPATQSYRGSCVRFAFDEAMTARIKAYARDANATVFMVLFAGFAALLSRYSGQEDIVIGTPVAGRNRVELEPLIGLFLNNLALRVDLGERPSFAELCKRVRHSVLDGFSQQELPFEQLVEALNPPRDLSHHPIYQVMFVLRHPRQAEMALPGLDVSLLDSEVVSADFLTLAIDEHPAGSAFVLRGSFEYATDVFDAATIERMAGHYQNLLAGCLETPETRIADVSLLSPDERDELLSTWNQTAADYPRDACLHHLFRAQVQRSPDAIAVEFEGTAWSYRTLEARVIQLAHHLRAMDVGPGDRVGICIPRSLDMLVALLGVLQSGAAYVPLDPDYPTERLTFMIEDAWLSALLTHEALLTVLPSARCPVVCLDRDWAQIQQQSSEAQESPIDPEALAYVIYTSGSTGKPKGVAIPHRALVNFLCSMTRAPGIGADDALLAVTTISFDIAGLELFWPLVNGARLVLASREAARDGKRLLATLRASRVTVMQATPETWRLLIAAGWDGQPPLVVLCGGEAFPHSLAKQLCARSELVWNLYGPTETTIWSARYRVRGQREGLAEDAPEPIGEPLANTQLYVLEPNLEPAPLGVPGELFIGGDGLAKGYFGQEALTAERFIDNRFGPGKLYKTGDLVRRRVDGLVEFLGRTDHQIKLRGFRIELGEVEAALAGHPAVQEALALVTADKPDDRRLYAYVVLREEVPVQELRGFLRDRLPSYMLPAAIVPLDAIPRTPNGKADRSALPPPDAARRRAPQLQIGDEVERRILEIWKDVLGSSAIGVDENFFEIGGHSFLLLEVQQRMEGCFECSLEVINLFRHPTVRSQAELIRGAEHVGRAAQALVTAAAPWPPGGQAIAVIGMAGRFPDAKDVQTFWDNLVAGREAIRFFEKDELLAAGIDQETLSHPRYVRARGFLAERECFDAPFFGYSPREAELMDPQQRHFLECAWSAIEHAGYDPARYPGRVGVYGGVGMNTYLLDNLMGHPGLMAAVGDYQILLGNDKDFTATRVSYQLDLTGPSVNVNTACSTSLAAVALACQALQANQCDMALAGGSSIKARGVTGYLHQEGMILSPDGHCRPFDAEAAGTVSGDGVGVVVLKRLEDALADGDWIHAVIKGSAMNNDGSHKVGFTAPSVDGQAAVIRAAQAAAQVEPETIQYIEAHGTATTLGDPIEIAALTQAFGAGAGAPGSCAIGSVKSNIGHLDAAAGVAGLIKAVLALEHRQIPPSLHFERPNPRIDFARSPFFVNTELRDWVPPAGAPRRAGVSAFGLGGTNVHVVLEEAPARSSSESRRPYHVLPLSAKTTDGLEQATANLSAYLRAHRELAIADVAYTLAVGRQPFAHRRVVISRDIDEAIEVLETRDPKCMFTRSLHAASPTPPAVVFAFPGQGSQHVGMGGGLYRTEPVFRDAIDQCAELLRDAIGCDLRTLLFPPEETALAAATEIERTDLTQISTFVVEYALARLWISWGLQPRAVLGHSLGELAAASVAGVFTLEGALALVVTRGRLSRKLPAGGMMAFAASEATLAPLCGDQLSIAAINGPESCVLSGAADALDALAEQLLSRGIESRRLRIAHAFHSAALDPMVPAFVEAVRGASPRPSMLPFMSTLMGEWLDVDQLADAAYWARQLRETVRFHDALERVGAEMSPVLLEVGPGTTLSTLARRSGVELGAIVSSLPHAGDPLPDSAALMTALGKLWLTGVQIDLATVYAGEQRRRVPLPTYPFERLAYWIAPRTSAEAPAADNLRKQSAIADWFYQPSWKRSRLPVRAPEVVSGGTVIFVDDLGVGGSLADHLRAAGDRVHMVLAGPRFEELGPDRYTVVPDHGEHYEALFDALRRRGDVPRRLVHCWTVTGSAPVAPDTMLERGCISLLFLAQAIGNSFPELPMSLTVISDGLREITGDEIVHPDKATLLGPLKAIPLELPQVTCASVDLATSRESSARFGAQLAAEVSSDHGDREIAYRGKHRWALDYQPISLPRPDHTRLREGGVYWITGGLGGVGLMIARHLARTRRAKLILTGRSALPPREEWVFERKYDRGGVAIGASEMTVACVAQDEALRHHLRHRERGAALDRLDRLCVSLIAAYWRKLGVEMRAGQSCSLDALRRTLGCLPAFDRLLHACVRMFEQDGLVARSGDVITFLAGVEALPDPAGLGAEIGHDAPSLQGIVTLLDHCVQHYPVALAGDIPAIGVLYPGGDASFLNAHLREAASYSALDICADLLRRLVETSGRGDRPLRILEIGGGSGQLTRRLLPTLRNARVSYCFTDIGRSFVTDAERHFQAEAGDSMSFAIADVSRDLLAQGFAPESFDFIVGLDVVHATPYLERTVRHLSAVLAPGGLICLLETVNPPRWFDMVWGLTNDWWSFADAPLRTQSPLLPLDRWEQLFLDAGFAEVTSFPRAVDLRHRTDMAVILARSEPRPGQESGESSAASAPGAAAIQAILELEALGAEVLPVTSDVSDPAQVRDIVALAQARFGALHGVIHAAAVSAQRSLSLKTRAQLDQELAPKVTGTRALVAGLADVELDFLALFSSISTLVGGLGQTGYIAANSYLDAFAAANATANDDSRIISINWDRWSGIGVARDLEEWHLRQTGESLGDGMSAEEAIDALERILAHRPGPRVVVSSRPLAALIESARQITVARLSVTGAQRGHERPELGISYVAPRDPIERTIADAFGDVLGVAEVGVNDHFADLGGDSLIAIRIVARLNEALNVHLSVRSLFDGPTVAEVARRVRESRAHEAAERPAAEPVVRKPLTPTRRNEPAPLTSAQMRLCFLERLEGPSATYNIPIALRLRGPLDIDVLERSLDEIVRRHGSLRTRIAEVDGKPMQLVTPDGSLLLSRVSLDGETLDARLVQARTWVTEEAERVFDLAVSPLARASLLELAPDDHVFAMTVHHIVADGWSMVVLIRELAALYEAFSQGRSSPLAALPIQYTDVAWAQFENRLGLELEKARAFWQDRLRGAPPLLELLPDNPRPPVQPFRGRTAAFEVTPAITSELLGIGRGRGASLFMTLFASFLVLLERYSGREDLVVGTPVANRMLQEIEPLIGLFTNTLVLRTDASGDPSFLTLLDRVRDVALDAYNHQEMPFEQLIEILEPERNLSYMPVVQVMFTFHDRDVGFLSIPALDVSQFDFDVLTAKCDLTLDIQETVHGGLRGSFIYNQALFDSDTIDALIGHFQTLLEGIVAAPASPVSELPLLTFAERHRLLHDFQGVALDYPRQQTLVGAFSAQVERTPDATATAFGDQRLSYRELDRRANQLAHFLRSMGIGPESRVGLCFERSLDLIVGVLGILKASAAYVPLHPAHPVARIAFAIEDASVPVVLTHRSLLEHLPVKGNTPSIVRLDRRADEIQTYPSSPPPCAAGPDSLAYVIYTSGSTGQPKGILIEHRSVMNLVAGLKYAVYGDRVALRVALVASTVFDASVQQIFAALLGGHALHVVDDDTCRDGAALLEYLRVHRIDLSDCTPSLLLLLAEAGLGRSPDLPLQLLLCGGEALPSSLPRRVLRPEQPLAIVNVYGPTECCVDNTSLTISADSMPSQSIVPLGRPLPNTRVHVLDGHGQLAPIGVTGEICIAGDSVGRGYLGKPDLDAERFIAAPALDESRVYRTGDLGRWTRTGQLEYLGRSDGQVKIRGYRVELGEVEARLREHPDVRDAVVTTSATASGTSELIAYVTAVTPPTALALREFLTGKLPDYMLPARFVALERFPLNASGKIDRAALPSVRELPAVAHGVDYRPATSWREQALVEVWEDVLERAGIGVDDNYFALGGDSIKALQIAARLRDRELRLSLRDLFRYRSIAELAPHLEELAEVVDAPAPATGEVPLTPAQRAFLDHFAGNRAHFNQALLFTTAERLDPELLALALRAVEEHHDGLRLRYRRVAGAWLQEYVTLPEAAPLTEIDLRDRQQPHAALEAHAAAAQAGLDLRTSPLFQAILYHLPDCDQLFVFAHHLIIDVVSWRILLEDLETAYSAVLAGEAPRLPSRTSSFQAWARALERFAASEVLDELLYWEALEACGPTAAVADFPECETTYRDRCEHIIRLPAVETAALLSESHRAYNTESNDLLLTALSRAFARVRGQTSLAVTLEGHGREPVFDDVDVTRTAGWFTTLFPVVLDITGSDDIGRQVKQVKETLRTIPRRGLGYGVLRYLTDPTLRPNMKFDLQPRVSWNYLGDLGSASPSQRFRVVSGIPGPTVDPDAQPVHDIDFLAMVRNGCFELSIGYAGARFQRSSIETLGQALHDELIALIGHTRGKSVPELTPSDIDFDGFDVDQLDAFLDDLSS